MKKRARARQALDLRISGRTYAQIGTTLGVSIKTAYDDVQDELGRLDAAITQFAERVRAHKGVLDWRSLFLDAIALRSRIWDGDPRAIAAARRFMELRARLDSLVGE
jgi:hypothetical protein